jgi:hypothetical protein
MSNSFYNHGAFPSTGSAATSASMRAELDLVAAGFDKMPTLSGNANKFVVVNSTGTALTQTSTLPSFTVTDTDFTVQDDGDNTRKFQFNAGTVTPGATRIYSVPDANTTLVGTDTTQTLTNKTLTAPVISSIVNTGSLTLPTSTDTLVGRATTDTLTNKTLTSPVIGTIVNTGTLTLPTSTDTLVGRATTDTLTNKTLTSPVIGTIVNTGTLTLPTSTDTLVGRATTDTLTNKTLTSPVIGTIVNTGTLTLPTSTDTLVGRATTDTLTNKTLTSPVIGTIVNTGTLTLPTSTDTLVGRATTDTLTNKTLGAFTISGTVSGGGNQINNVIIGTSNPLAGTFTDLSTTGLVRIPSANRSAAAALTPTNPAFLYGVASTYTDTSSSGPLTPIATFYSLAQPTLSTSNVTTYATAATLYLANAPVAGGSATITNAYSLYVAAGASYFGGAVTFASSVGALTVSSLTNTGLTSGRVPYSTTAGLQTDSANLTFNGTTLTANTIGAFTLGGTVAGGGNQINNVIIGTTNPLAGAFTTLSASSTVTLSGGTANGVAYLNGSKVLTTGSALTFDGGTVANINGGGTGFSTQDAASNFSILRLGTDTGNGYAFFQSGKSGTGTTLPFAWRQDSSELMRLTSTGLGIGTTSPATKLDVVNAANRVARLGGFQFSGTTSSADGGNNILGSGVYWNGSNLTATQTSGAVVQLGNGAIAFQALSGLTAGSTYSYSPQMTLDSSGNLGIGTTSPSGRLHVNSTGAAIAYIQSTLAAGNTNVETRYISTNRTWGVGQNIIQTSSIFEIADVTASATRLAIDSSGNVGIGTATPPVTLSVAGTVGIFGGSLNGSIGSPQLYRPVSDTLAIATGATERMRIDSSGNLLVGTTTANANFYVYNAPVSYAGLNTTAIFSSSASQSTGTGGLIAFEGKYTSGGALANFAAIGGLKENSTDNNYSGYLGFYTRSNGSLAAERARIDSSGNFMVGHTSSSGLVGNNALIVGGNFSTVNGNGSIATSPTTVITLPSRDGAAYIFSAQNLSDANTTTYGVVSIITQQGTALVKTDLQTASFSAVTISGLNIQLTSTLSTKVYRWSLVRIL